MVVVRAIIIIYARKKCITLSENNIIKVGFEKSQHPFHFRCDADVEKKIAKSKEEEEN